MNGIFDIVAKRALFYLDAEAAHGLTIRALKAGLVPPVSAVSDKRLVVKVAGIDFPNPVGLAAGFDKNAEAPDAVLKLGFGFTEIGTVTPRPQAGNPKPRVFRLTGHDGVINRLGFNNEGHDAAARRLAARRSGGIVGVNIGANKDTEDFAADYEAGIDRLHNWADYFTANISSPNTPGLRSLQAGEALRDLLERVLARRDRLERHIPVFLKLAPDLDERQMDEIAGALDAVPPDAVIISNTTLSRNGVEAGRNAQEPGGLSGKPLFERSTIILARMRQRLASGLPIIGVGGIDSAEAAIDKLQAGANLVQLYTGMIYRGPGLAAQINRGLVREVERRGIASITALTGEKTGEWAARPLAD